MEYSLLLNIFKYRERKKHSPLENFTTEVFTYLLNNLHKTDTEVANRLFNLLNISIPFNISTQRVFYVKLKEGEKKVIPDITIESNNECTTIEVKVESPLNQYNLNGEDVDQIQLYKKIDINNRVLALSKYSIISPYLKQENQIYWSDVFDILLESKNEIARNFTNFLREYGMDSVKPIEEHSNRTVTLSRSLLTQIERSWNNCQLTLYEDLCRDWLGFKIKSGNKEVGWIGLLLGKEDHIIIETFDNALAEKYFEKNKNEPEYDSYGGHLIIAQLPLAELVKLKTAKNQISRLQEWIRENIKLMNHQC